MGPIAGKVGAATSFVEQQSQPSRRTSRRVRLALIAAAPILLVTAALAYNYQLLRVASVLGFRDKQPAILTAYDHLFNHHFEVRDAAIAGTLGPVNLVIYSASGVRNPAPIILVHGFADAGNRDPYLNDVAKRLAPMGFLVILPTIPGEAASEMRRSDLLVIEDTIRWAAENTHQKVAVLGVSFGGGLVVPAAAAHSVSKYVKLIVCISGYNDLESIGKYFIHDPVLDPEGKPYQGNSPGPLLITAPYLNELVDTRDISDMKLLVHRFLMNKAQPLPPDDPVLSSVNGRDRKEYEQLQSVQSEEMKDRFRQLLARHKDDFDAISPSHVLRDLRTPIYILHGVSDSIFPSGEAEWMREESKNNPNAHILITPWISHVFVGSPASRLDRWRTMQFCTQMLTRAAHREMLTN